MTAQKIKDLLILYIEELTLLYPVSEIEAIFWVITEKITEKNRLFFTLNLNEFIADDQVLIFKEFLEDLKTNKPLQYILKEAPFYGSVFYVNQHVLIPRPETEELVDLIIKQNHINQMNVLDIGTGSGCIAISLKKKNPNWEITAVDLSVNALNVAKKNADQLEANVHFVNANILDWSPDFKWDIIVSNPPYITFSEKKEMHPNVLLFEPHMALFVEQNDALQFYKAIVVFAQKRLNKQGQLYFEINEKYGTEVSQLFNSHGFKSVSIYSDVSGKERIVKGTLIS